MPSPPRPRPISPAADSAPPAECDYVVVGAGIVGLAVARELARRHAGARVAVIERERRIGAHQTGHTSGVVHAGIYYRPGSLKARLCVAGARRLYAYCEEREIEARKGGKLIIAGREEELGRLDGLELRGRENGVPGLRRISADEIPAVEPNARGLAALHSPTTGVVDFSEVAAAYAEDLVGAGGSIHLGCAVRRVSDAPGAAVVEHRAGRTRARAAITCAGIWSDRLAVASGAPADPIVVPFRGAYLRVGAEHAGLVRSMIYPVPDPALPFLGAHLTRSLDGGLVLGPTALLVAARDAYRIRRLRPRDLAATLAWPGTWRMMRRFWRTGVREIGYAVSRRRYVAECARFVPSLALAAVEPGPAGVRAQALSRDGALADDFIVSRSAHVLHVRNAPSPAATSSLALAELIADTAGA